LKTNKKIVIEIEEFKKLIDEIKYLKKENKSLKNAVEFLNEEISRYNNLYARKDK